jgi:UDP-N-acetylmuramoyl-L-alanyl-D-glutamate--2,6-diaminopimelate ligase
LAARFTSAGVTGTNGKTSTTTWVAAALAAAGHPCVRVTTLGAALVAPEGERPLEVPASLDGFYAALRLGADQGAAHAAVECTSEALAAGFARGWPMRVAGFTNLTHDHLDAHGSPEHYLASKAQLFLALPPGGVAVLNAVDETSALLTEIVPPHARIVRYGVDTRDAASFVALAPTLDLAATSVVVEPAGTRCELRGLGRFAALSGRWSIRTHGAIFIENALCALAVAVELGVAPEVAARAIGEAAPPPGRFEIVAGGQGGETSAVVAVDYAHTPDALARTLATARALATGRVTVVFGAGGLRDKDKRPEMGRAARAADRVILTTDNPRGEDPADIARAIRRGLEGHPGVERELDRARAIERAVREAMPGDVVVIAGKGHERTQTVGGEVRPFDDAAIVREVVRGIAKP